MKKQLPPQLEKELSDFYGALSFTRRLNEHITCLATAENMPGHIMQVQGRVDRMEKYRKNLEAKLDEFGFDYSDIKKKYLKKRNTLVDFFNFSLY